jgi:tellurite resistance protein TerC
MENHKIWVSLIFFFVVAGGLILDLGLFNKRSDQAGLTLKQSATRTALWFALGLVATALIGRYHGYLHGVETSVSTPAGAEQSFKDLQAYSQAYHVSLDLNEGDPEGNLAKLSRYASTSFFTGYLVEYALSMDNLFVMLLIFQSFKVRPHEQKEILVWGVIGAVILRGVFVFLGAALVQKFHVVLYGFGLLLLYSGFKLFFGKDDSTADPSQHKLLVALRKVLPISDRTPEGVLFRFREEGKTWFTPLFLVLVLIELTDVVFAVDSVPAIFGITTDPYLVFFSNILAVMGLRSLFFLLGHSLDKFYALQYGLSMILVFIGAKMLLESYFHAIGFTYIHNLAVIVGILLTSIAWSLTFPRVKDEAANV